jgi:hypothetical protein
LDFSAPKEINTIVEGKYASIKEIAIILLDLGVFD